MPRVTLSYRRDDSAGIARLIFERLKPRYGADSVFMDIDSIEFGEDFRERIHEALRQTDFLLVLIGPKWLGETSSGRSRIMDANDPVRMEVERALEIGLRVVPILLERTPMPSPDDLPASLGRLPYLNAAEVTAGRDFDSQIERIIRFIDRTFADVEARRARESQEREQAEHELAERARTREAERAAAEEAVESAAREREAQAAALLAEQERPSVTPPPAPSPAPSPQSAATPQPPRPVAPAQPPKAVAAVEPVRVNTFGPLRYRDRMLALAFGAVAVVVGGLLFSHARNDDYVVPIFSMILIGTGLVVFLIGLQGKEPVATSKTVAELGAMYVDALREWLPDGTRSDYAEFVRTGVYREAVATLKAQRLGRPVDPYGAAAPLSQERRHAQLTFDRIANLDAKSRSAVERAALSILDAGR